MTGEMSHAAQLLQLPESAFAERFRQMLGACSVVREDDYVGPSMHRSDAKLRKVRAQRAAEEKKREDSLAASRKRTAALEREAEEEASVDATSNS